MEGEGGLTDAKCCVQGVLGVLRREGAGGDVKDRRVKE